MNFQLLGLKFSVVLPLLQGRVFNGKKLKTFSVLFLPVILGKVLSGKRQQYLLLCVHFIRVTSFRSHVSRVPRQCLMFFFYFQALIILKELQRNGHA